jgi:hypothetical protein
MSIMSRRQLPNRKIYLRASPTISASLNRPGRNQVRDLNEDSIVPIVGAFITRNFSYLAGKVVMSIRGERKMGKPSLTNENAGFNTTE